VDLPQKFREISREILAESRGKWYNWRKARPPQHEKMNQQLDALKFITEGGFFMKSIYKDLSEIIKYLTEIKTHLEKRRTDYKGRLKSCHGVHGDRYYLTSGGKTRYLKKAERGIAEAYSQQEFDRKLCVDLNAGLKKLNKALKYLSSLPWERVYKTMPPAKRALVKLPVKSDAELKQDWLNQEYGRMEFHNDELIYRSLRGQLFRSKSEATIADFFDEAGIAFAYERGLKLRDGRTIYPDFTLFMPHTGREIIWEHFGMIDNDEYAEKAVHKMMDYADNGFFPGIDFFCTFETSSCPLDKATVKAMISAILEHNE